MGLLTSNDLKKKHLSQVCPATWGLVHPHVGKLTTENCHRALRPPAPASAALFLGCAGVFIAPLQLPVTALRVNFVNIFSHPSKP